MILMNEPFSNKHIELLIHAFEKDPMFVKLFKGPKKNHQMKAFFRFVYQRNQLLGDIFLTDSGLNPTYVCFIETPIHKHKILLKDNVKLALKMIKLAFYIPIRSLNFLSKYDSIIKKQRPNEKHYYLTMIGVSPEKQGLGIGKMVINSIHEMVHSDHDILSICLDTENPLNVSYYEHLGYSLTHESKIRGLSIYHMQKRFDTKED